MADLDELFGSDSEDDDDFQPQSAVPAADTEDAIQETLPEEPFEEEEEQEDVVEQDQAQDRGAFEDDGSDEGSRDPPPEQPMGPPMLLDGPNVTRPDSNRIAVAKLSNILNIETRAFHPATFEEEREQEYVDDRGVRRVRGLFANTIRWRRSLKEDGSEGIESNARFVRWSDGSLQLLVGDEVLDVSELNTEKDNNYLFLRHVEAQFLEGMGHIGRKLIFRPASLNSRFHQRLRQAVERRHTKVNRVRSVATVEDPAREKAERERAEEARIRATEQLERRQNKEMRRYTAGPRYESRPRGEAGITAQYLEAMDDDELGGDSDDADGLTATERARNALRRNIHDDAEAERRLSQAKRPQPSAPAPPPKRQHFGPIDSDDEDEYAADEDAAPRTAPKSRHRGLVLSDDDDD
ncbi:RNA polymerase-associated protein LEO1 [Coccomyxa sp. Obi]|nr:RNA polymerase-associated protein LEO1 [Coccomyxa sp. Obi]